MVIYIRQDCLVLHMECKCFGRKVSIRDKFHDIFLFIIFFMEVEVVKVQKFGCLDSSGRGFETSCL